MKRNLVVLVATLVALTFVFSMGCSKKSSDPVEAMLTHFNAMIKIMKDNKENCDKIVTDLEAYTKDHQKDFEELKNADKNMSDEEKKKLEERAMQKLEPIMKDMMGTMMEINQKCPTQAAKIGQAMEAIK